MNPALIGLISTVQSSMVDEKTKLRFVDESQFVIPESLIIHEQKLLSDERLLDACTRAYNTILVTPPIRYVPKEIINLFGNFNVVVLDYDVANSTVTLGTIPEFKDVRGQIFSDEYKLKFVLVPIYYYIEVRTEQYGTPDFLAELPLKDKWDFIIQEAISIGASDITITNTRTGAQVYYNARKKKVNSKRAIDTNDVNELAHLLASNAKATLADDTVRPRYFSIDVDRQNRGRVVINKTYYGYLITIRVFPNSVLNKTLEDLNLGKETCNFIREVMLSKDKGLRLFIGETMSGKNTTTLTALLELVNKGTLKIVSLEQPVELLVDGIEQINAETNEEFELNADSLLRQNPDIVYFTEITARTAKVVMEQSNTSKAVFSTIHANSISEVLFRLQDISSMPLDRILLTLHSCVYQELVRVEAEDAIYPVTRCLHFSEDLKMRLYGKTTAEIISILREEENKIGSRSTFTN